MGPLLAVAAGATLNAGGRGEETVRAKLPRDPAQIITQTATTATTTAAAAIAMPFAGN